MMDPENPPSRDPAKAAASSKLEATQRQVDEVVGIMKTNVERIIEREENLTKLDQRANDLTMSASQFQTTSTRLKRKYWWKNLKMMLILGIVIVIVIALIIILTVGIPSGGGGGGGGDSTTLAPPNATRLRRAVGSFSQDGFNLGLANP